MESADSSNRLVLEPRHWYGWQMLPGYIGDGFQPYFSPIHVHQIVPKKSGKRILRLDFFNALYAEGAKDFELDLRILKHENTYLVAELVYGPSHSERTAIISTIDANWIRRYCPDLWDSSRLPMDASYFTVSAHLDDIFSN